MTPDKRNSDRGSVLVLVLVIVVVFAMIGLSVAAYATANLRKTGVTRNKTEKVSAANAGIRYALEQLQYQNTLCGSVDAHNGVGESIPLPQLVLDRQVDLRCFWKAGLPSGVSGWALMATGLNRGSSNIISTQGGHDKTITGPAYIASQNSADYDLKKDLTVQNGSVFYYKPDCSTSGVLPSGVVVAGPTPPYTADCIAKTWDQLVTIPTLPAVPTVVNPAPIDVNGCRIFLPGKYTSINLGNGPVYFASGVYYLELSGQLSVDNALVGGKPGPGDTALLASQAGTCASMSDTNASIVGKPGVGGTGVTLILGNATSLYVNKGHLELFRRTSTDPNDPLTNVSILTVETTGAGYIKHVTAAGSDTLSTKSGNKNEMVIHGAYIGPRTGVSFGNATNSSYDQFRGGIVAGYVHLQSSASASNFLIQTDVGPFSQDLVLESRAKGKSAGEAEVVATVVLNISNDTGRPISVRSWRVS
jgi:hypothetical protein